MRRVKNTSKSLLREMCTTWYSKHLGSQNFPPKDSKNYLDQSQCFYARQKDKEIGDIIRIQQLPTHDSGRPVLYASELISNLLLWIV